MFNSAPDPLLNAAGSDGQALAALCTASIDDLAAVLGAHAGQKAMNFLALTLLGLKSSLHGCILRKNSSPVMGSILVPKWGQACNSTVYRIGWRSVRGEFSTAGSVHHRHFGPSVLIFICFFYFLLCICIGTEILQNKVCVRSVCTLCVQK